MQLSQLVIMVPGKSNRKIEHRTPLHLQLKGVLLQKIENGVYNPGDLIPSERQLAEQYGLNRMTVRGAIGALVSEGILKRVQGKGTYVIKQKIRRDLNNLQGFSHTMKDRGVHPTSKVLATQTIHGALALNNKMKLPRDADLFNITRLRLGDGHPIALEETYIPRNIIKNIQDIDFNVFSLYEAFSLNGILLKNAYQSLTVVRVNHPYARLLKIKEGASVFLFECLTYNQQDYIVEYTKSYTRGDDCLFYTELVKSN